MGSETSPSLRCKLLTEINIQIELSLCIIKRKSKTGFANFWLESYTSSLPCHQSWLMAKVLS